MSAALQKYKALVDELRDLSPASAESKVHNIDEQLRTAWEALCDSDKLEAEAYWRSSITMQIARPGEMN